MFRSLSVGQRVTFWQMILASSLCAAKQTDQHWQEQFVFNKTFVPTSWAGADQTGLILNRQSDLPHRHWSSPLRLLFHWLDWCSGEWLLDPLLIIIQIFSCVSCASCILEQCLFRLWKEQRLLAEIVRPRLLSFFKIFSPAVFSRNALNM